MIVPQFSISPKTPPNSILTPKSHYSSSNYSSSYIDNLIATEDKIELSFIFSTV